MKIGLISFRLLLFFLPFSISIRFRFVFVDFVSFCFVSFSLISLRFVSFRSYFVSHFIGVRLIHSNLPAAPRA